MSDKDNWLDDEWGNLHDEVLDPSWNRRKTKYTIEKHKLYHKDSNWRANWYEKKLAGAEQQRNSLVNTINKKLENDPDYFIKQNQAIADKVKQKRIQDPEYDRAFREKSRQASREFWDNADDEYRRNYGITVSEKLNPISPSDAFDIYYATHQLGNKNARSMKHYKQLSKKYKVQLGLIIAIARGDHYAFGGRRVGDNLNIRVNHEHVDPEHDYDVWYKSWFGILQLTDPQGTSYKFDNYNDAGIFMSQQEGIPVKEPLIKAFKKFKNLDIGEKMVGKQRFWKGWIFERKPHHD